MTRSKGALKQLLAPFSRSRYAQQRKARETLKKLKNTDFSSNFTSFRCDFGKNRYFLTAFQLKLKATAASSWCCAGPCRQLRAAIWFPDQLSHLFQLLLLFT
ncbi:MAG: hypothetical protein ACREX4_01685 [Gammaproteobacteria bacterium]